MDRGYLCGKQCTRQRKTLQYGTLSVSLYLKAAKTSTQQRRFPRLGVVTVLFNSQENPFFGLPYSPTAYYQMIHLFDKCLLSIYCVLDLGEKHSEPDSYCPCPRKVNMFYREGRLKVIKGRRMEMGNCREGNYFR